MGLTKSTKGTHVYGYNESDSPVSSIYIKRSGSPSEAPDSITPTIEYEEDSSHT